MVLWTTGGVEFTRQRLAVQVYARRAKSLTPLLKAGAQASPTPAALAKQCNVIITNVSDTPDVEEVLIGKLGVIHGVKKNAVIIDMSTIAPAASRRMAELFAKKNAFMWMRRYRAAKKAPLTAR